ncbi:ADP-ribosyltransferase, partial [Streptomyces sp. NPDC006743]|uniref:ADP-ribosyltransferase n=1 Tax=Streptomyces sp. NPDC006743 TaxID=3154480 RepID=UPI0034532D9F
ALSVAGKAGKVIDPMTYVAKGAGAGLSKIGDISKALKGMGKIDMPTLPDGSVHLPDGRLLDPHGNIMTPDGVVDTTPIPHEVAPNLPKVPTLPDHWTIHGQQPVYAGVHTGADGVTHTTDAAGHYDPTTPSSSYDHTAPSSAHDHTAPQSSYDHTPPTSYDHTPTPTSYDHTAPPYSHEHTPAGTPTHDVPGSGGHGSGGHGNGHDHGGAHGPAHDTPGGHSGGSSHGPEHDHHESGHPDHSGDHPTDHAGHTDEPVHGGDSTDLGHHAVDTAAHHGTPGHAGTDGPGHGTAGEPFEYKPLVSDAEWDRLTPAQQHQVAYAEISDGTRPFAADTDAVEYGQAYWNHYAENMPEVERKAVWDYTDEPDYNLPAPHPDGWGTYKEMNGYLRGDASKWSPYVQHNIDEVDKALAGHPVPEDVMVVRGTGIGHLQLDDPLEMLHNTYGDPGYLSTSLGDHPVSAFAHSEAILHLRVPKGTPALWVEKVGKFGMGERELLLGRGTAYRVTRVFMENGQVQVYGEVLPR